MQVPIVFSNCGNIFHVLPDNKLLSVSLNNGGIYSSFFLPLILRVFWHVPFDCDQIPLNQMLSRINLFNIHCITLLFDIVSILLL
jgi:hypothetical protein